MDEFEEMEVEIVDNDVNDVQTETSLALNERGMISDGARVVAIGTLMSVGMGLGMSLVNLAAKGASKVGKGVVKLAKGLKTKFSKKNKNENSTEE